MHHADRVVGKVELRDHVWDGDGDDVNVVEVYVGYLRRKLGRDVGGDDPRRRVPRCRLAEPTGRRA